MADRTLVDENMAVSSDNMVSQQNLVETNKEENDGRGNQNNPKTDAPKKKTTFKITSVTKSSQPRGGNGDLTQDNDGDSIDDLDETVDSHTEDLSSEIYDTSSKATDVDNLDPLLTPEEVTKEKPGRFKVVKVESKEPFKRGRWLCYDFLDTPDNRQEEIHVNSGSSSAANSLHYVHGVDDPSKNPLSAGATGTVSSQRQQDTGLNRTPVDMFQPIQPAPVSQPVLNQVPITTGLLNNSMANAGFLNQMVQSVSNVPYSNHIAQSLPNAHPIASHVGQQGPVSYTVNTALPGHSLGHLITVSKGMHGVGSVPNLVEIHGQGIVSQCLPGTIPNPSVQHQQSQPHHQPPQPTPVGMSNTANVHSHQTPAPILAAQILNAVPLGEYSNSTATISGQVAMGQHQQQTQSTLGYNLSTTTTVNNAPGVVPLQNHLGALGSQDIANIEGNVMLEQNVNVMPSSSTADLSTILPRVPEIGERVEENIPVSSLAPLETAIGGITNPTQDEEITEEAYGLDYEYELHDDFLELLMNGFGGSGLLVPHLVDESGPLIPVAKTAHVTWQDEKETPTPATSTPCPDLDLASPPSSPAPRVPKPQLKPLERRPSLRSQVQDQIEQDSGSSTVAIDNKIEQAMDLVKSHLMYAVREEVEVLKEQIKELMDRLSQLEYENNFLRREATQETLSKLAAAQSQPQPPPSS